MERNKAAKRLHERTTLQIEHDLINEALRAERRATVDRIRAEVEGRTWPVDPFTGEPTESRIFTILEREAAR